MYYSALVWESNVSEEFSKNSFSFVRCFRMLLEHVCCVVRHAPLLVYLHLHNHFEAGKLHDFKLESSKVFFIKL